jgi:hypothetical protein
LVLAFVVMLLASPVGAQADRIEVMGRVPAGDDAPRGVPLRRAAVDNALAHAVATVARDLAEGFLVLGPEGDEAWKTVVDGDPARFALRYRVLEDLGERPAAEATRSGATEYVVRVEVQVDTKRLARRLGELGYPVGGISETPGLPFLMEVRGVPSWSAYTALRQHLLERAGARSALPESFEAGRVVLRVEAPGGASGLLERLLADTPPGLRVEPLAVSEAALAIRLTGRP